MKNSIKIILIGGGIVVLILVIVIVFMIVNQPVANYIPVAVAPVGGGGSPVKPVGGGLNWASIGSAIGSFASSFRKKNGGGDSYVQIPPIDVNGCDALGKEVNGANCINSII